jgi:hypothetical protein
LAGVHRVGILEESLRKKSIMAIKAGGKDLALRKALFSRLHQVPE